VIKIENLSGRWSTLWNSDSCLSLIVLRKKFLALCRNDLDRQSPSALHRMPWPSARLSVAGIPALGRLCCEIRGGSHPCDRQGVPRMGTGAR
jgi:hypothetical protein